MLHLQNRSSVSIPISGYGGPTWAEALGFCESNGLVNDSGRESDKPAWLVSNDFVDEASLNLLKSEWEPNAYSQFTFPSRYIKLYKTLVYIINNLIKKKQGLNSLKKYYYWHGKNSTFFSIINNHYNVFFWRKMILTFITEISFTMTGFMYLEGKVNCE
jgi:hypothetical protein